MFAETTSASAGTPQPGTRGNVRSAGEAKRAGPAKGPSGSQRVSTIQHAHQIVVLDHGRMVGLGTHDELLETCETYREIVDSQLSAQEAA